MTEDFLHYIWKFGLFDQENLSTTEGETLQIINAGLHNFDAGPDFFNSRLRIGETVWAGNVEVHTLSSDYNRHGHHADAAYENIILHVVLDDDKILAQKNGNKIPTLVLKERIHEKQYKKYLELKESWGWIPCEKYFPDAPPLIIDSMLDRMLSERLEHKLEFIKNKLELNHNNWEETFYQILARSFGFHTNAEPFELLAKSLSSSVLAKQKESYLQLEALLFGQAGMLDEHFSDAYPRSLQNEYVYLKRKFKLQPIQKHLWKFLRLRPLNFPTIRIAQFANLIYNSSHLFRQMLDALSVEDLEKMFRIEVSAYWKNHYTFDRLSTVRNKALGPEGFSSIMINAIIPFLFTYGRLQGEIAFEERALRFLETLKSERNSVISRLQNIGFPCLSAYHSQALLHLKSNYCEKRACLNCQIGNYLLKNS